MSIVRPILRRQCSMSWNPGDVPATWGDPGAPGIQAPGIQAPGELSRGPLASDRGQRGTTVDAPREPPTPPPSSCASVGCAANQLVGR